MMATVTILKHNIEYWYGEEQKMPDHAQDHIKEMIIAGFNSGQLVDVNHETGMENVGWWKIA